MLCPAPEIGNIRNNIDPPLFKIAEIISPRIFIIALF
jgi:hypothetical protein